MKDSKDLPTYGDRPVSFVFSFEENGVGDRYYIGSEVNFRSV